MRAGLAAVWTLVVCGCMWDGAAGKGLMVMAYSEESGGADSHSPDEYSDGAQQASCDQNALSSCLSATWKDWSHEMFQLKENVVGIEKAVCDAARKEIWSCVEDKALTAFHCNAQDVQQTVAQITDILLHKNNSGSLLRSYYVTGFVCTPEGQALRERITKDCLMQEHIGMNTFDALYAIDVQLAQNHTANVQERCKFLENRSLMMRKVGNKKCSDAESGAAAGQLMCESIKSAYLDMHRDKFSVDGQLDPACDFGCKPETPGNSDNGGQPGSDDGQKGTGDNQGPGQTDNGQNHAQVSDDSTTDPQSLAPSTAAPQLLTVLLAALAAVLAL